MVKPSGNHDDIAYLSQVRVLCLDSWLTKTELLRDKFNTLEDGSELFTGRQKLEEGYNAAVATGSNIAIFIIAL